MPRDPRYDVLFEPVQIGPVTAKNRFYQVPHCNGLGFRDPTAMAAMREVKAEGGWGVVCTEQTDIHHSSEITPFIELRLWDDRDMPMLARVAERVHAHGALAGIELAFMNQVDVLLPQCIQHVIVDIVEALVQRDHAFADIVEQRLQLLLAITAGETGQPAHVGHAHAEKLIQVIGENAEVPNAFDNGDGRVSCFLQYALVESEPGQFFRQHRWGWASGR